MKYTLILMILGAIAISGCQKKNEDAPPAGPAPCGEGTTFAPGFGKCVANGHCQLGTVQHPQQPTMCADIRTSQVIGTQRCASGYVLTIHACLIACPNNPSQGQISGTCIQGITPAEGPYQNTNTWNPNQNQFSTYPQGYNQNGFYQGGVNPTGYPIWGAYGRIY